MDGDFPRTSYMSLVAVGASARDLPRYGRLPAWEPSVRT